MKPLPSSIAFVVKLVIGVAVLAFVLARVELSGILAAARGLQFTTLIAALALYFMAHGINALKLRLLLPQLSLFQSWRFTMIAVLYGTALSGQLVGDAVKALRMARAAQTIGDMATAAAAVAADKAVGMFALLLLMALGVGLEVNAFGREIAIAATVVTILAAVGLGAIVAAPLPRWLGLWTLGFTDWRRLTLQPATLLKSLALGLLVQSLSICVFVLVGADLGIPLAPSAWAVVVGLVSVVLLLPITVAGIGLRDGSLVAVLGLLGHGASAALALSFVLLAINLAGAGVGLLADLAGRDR